MVFIQESDYFSGRQRRFFHNRTREQLPAPRSRRPSSAEMGTERGDGRKSRRRRRSSSPSGRRSVRPVDDLLARCRPSEQRPASETNEDGFLTKFVPNENVRQKINYPQ